MIVYEMNANTKGRLALQASKHYGISRTATSTFMHIVRIAMKSNRNHPIDGDV